MVKPTNSIALDAYKRLLAQQEESERKRSSQSEKQRAWQKAAERAWNKYVVCRSLEEFQQVVKRYMYLPDAAGEKGLSSTNRP